MPSHTATVGASTYQSIKRDIIFGTLAPGAKLKLDGLNVRYAASPSTLREALNRLTSDGFVTSPEQRGFFVADVSPEDLTEVANLRSLLECHALRLSIKHGDTDWEGNLVAAHHKLSRMEKRMAEGEASEEEVWKRYDQEFHLALIAACDSRNLLSLHTTIFAKYLRYQLLVLTNRGTVAVQEHRELMNAALDRDMDRAVHTLETHIHGGLTHTLEAMANTKGWMKA